MIERLVTTLQQLAVLTGQEPGNGIARLRGDCADAVRLELDCPQQSLTPPQRAALLHLNDLLEKGEAPAAEVAAAARSARAVLGISASR